MARRKPVGLPRANTWAGPSEVVPIARGVSRRSWPLELGAEGERERSEAKLGSLGKEKLEKGKRLERAKGGEKDGIVAGLRAAVEMRWVVPRAWRGRWLGRERVMGFG